MNFYISCADENANEYCTVYSLGVLNWLMSS